MSGGRQNTSRLHARVPYHQESRLGCFWQTSRSTGSIQDHLTSHKPAIRPQRQNVCERAHQTIPVRKYRKLSRYQSESAKSRHSILWWRYRPATATHSLVTLVMVFLSSLPTLLSLPVVIQTVWERQGAMWWHSEGPAAFCLPPTKVSTICYKSQESS